MNFSLGSSRYLDHCICLNPNGVPFQITAIGDNIDDISNEIRSFSEKFDYVFTTGGVGPTHDDKTYIGKSFKGEGGSV